MPIAATKDAIRSANLVFGAEFANHIAELAFAETGNRPMPEMALTERLQWKVWQPIETAPKDGSFIWLSDGFFMRLGYWYVVTKDPTQEHWADMALAEAHEASDLQWTPKLWQPLPDKPVLKD